MSEAISDQVAAALADAEALMTRSLASEVSMLREAARLAVLAGGKRLRPTLLLLAQQAAGHDEAPPAVTLAAAVEMLHTASLIHDDINDRSDLRRGRPTVRSRWSNSAALLVGDFVFVRLLGMVADEGAEVIHLLAAACRDLIEGETMQLESAWDASLTPEGYFEIICKKTAALLAVCTELGALAAEASLAERQALREYGHHLGLAYQIRDDILDLAGDPAALGKPTATDLSQGLLSLPALYALQARPELAASLEDCDPQPLHAAIMEGGAIERASEVAHSQAAQARAALSSTPSSAARDELSRLACWAAQRNA